MKNFAFFLNIGWFAGIEMKINGERDYNCLRRGIGARRVDVSPSEGILSTPIKE